MGRGCRTGEIPTREDTRWATGACLVKMPETRRGVPGVRTWNQPGTEYEASSGTASPGDYVLHPDWRLGVEEAIR